MPIDKLYLQGIAEGFGYCDSAVSVEEFVDMVYENVIRHLPQPVLPRAGESLAITATTPKIASLAHDKILRVTFPFNEIPDEVCCYCATSVEILLAAGRTLLMEAINRKMSIGKHKPNGFELTKRTSFLLRGICSEITTTLNCTPIAYYGSESAYLEEFKVGPQQVLTAAIENIVLVDEDSLTWEQVLEFRKDTEARAKYRRMVRWIDEELKSKSPAAVQDLIAIRLDDYEWGIKKHGMKTVTGALSCVLDPKFLGAASLAVGASALAGGEFWAALSGATVTIGGAAVSFGKSYIDSLDERRKENYEVAYIHDIKKKTT